MSYKQVILIRNDLKLPKGKLAVQVSHASVETVLNSKKEIVNKWRKLGGKKVVLKVKDLEELLQFQKEAQKRKLVNVLISDAGLTVLAKGTITCLGIGPDEEKKIDLICGRLKLL